jgi:hypothetical protein
MNRYSLKWLLARMTDYIEVSGGLTSRFVEYMTEGRKNSYEVEHVWSNHWEQHQDEFKHKADFDEYRNRFGALLLLPRTFNASYGDLPYEKKLPHYLKQNLLAQSLNPEAYTHHPPLKKLIQSGLLFQGHEQFKKVDIEARQILYAAIAKEVWNPDRVAPAGDSAPASKFNIVSKPKVCSDEVKQAVEGGLTETEQLRVKFWTALTDYVKSAHAAFQCNSVAPKYWLRVKSPLQGFRFGFEISARDQYIDAYVGSHSEEKMDVLRGIYRDHRKEFEGELGEKVDWQDNKEGGAFWISVFREDDPSDSNNWAAQHQWMKDAMDKLLKAVGKYVSSGPNVESEADQ